eukprot:gene2773-4181_t
MGQFSSEEEEVLSDKKFLLIGTGDGGKSTIFKSFAMSNSPAFLAQKKKSFIDDIHRNILQTMAELCQYCFKKNVKFNDPQNKDFAQKIIETVQQDEIALIQKVYTKKLHSVIEGLWKEPEIQKALPKCILECHVLENALHFFSNISRFEPGNVQLQEIDILSCTKKTIGINSFKVELEHFKKKITCTIVDTGGQRNERKKWKQCYLDVNAVIFVASLSEFDQVIYEDDKSNRMMESINLFESIMNEKALDGIPIFLIFNKFDLFEEKMKTGDLSLVFNDYDELPSMHLIMLNHPRVNIHMQLITYATNILRRKKGKM